jgi:DNA replication protein DnaC
MKSLKDLWKGITPPTFDHVCPTCRAPSTHPRPCLACEDAQRATQQAKAATAASMPTRFGWARGLNAPELAARVDATALEQARAIDVVRLDRATLLGPATAGKTSLAVAMAHAWAIAHARPALFLAAVDLGVARQQHGLGEGEPPLVRQAMSAPLLVLDDVGQEADFGSSVVAHVIQHRYDRVKPTIATTGFTVEQLVSRYGAGVARRLIETAGGAVVLKLRSRRERGEAR